MGSSGGSKPRASVATGGKRTISADVLSGCCARALPASNNVQHAKTTGKKFLRSGQCTCETSELRWILRAENSLEPPQSALPFQTSNYTRRTTRSSAAQRKSRCRQRFRLIRIGQRLTIGETLLALSEMTKRTSNLSDPKQRAIFADRRGGPGGRDSIRRSTRFHGGPTPRRSRHSKDSLRCLPPISACRITTARRDAHACQ